MIFEIFNRENEAVKEQLIPNIPAIKKASEYKIAVAGSLGYSIGKYITSGTKSNKIPADIDLVCNSNEIALAFIFDIITKIEMYNWYGKIHINNKTTYCFEGTTAHYKLINSFGLNLCVFVNKEPIKYYFTKDGICVQDYKQILSFFEIASKIDNKNRPKE